MNYTIQAKYRDEEFEEVDTADTRKTALFLKKEYMMAYGNEFTIKIKQASICK